MFGLFVYHITTGFRSGAQLVKYVAPEKRAKAAELLAKHAASSFQVVEEQFSSEYKPKTTFDHPSSVGSVSIIDKYRNRNVGNPYQVGIGPYSLRSDDINRQMKNSQQSHGMGHGMGHGRRHGRRGNMRGGHMRGGSMRKRNLNCNENANNKNISNYNYNNNNNSNSNNKTDDVKVESGSNNSNNNNNENSWLNQRKHLGSEQGRQHQKKEKNKHGIVSFPSTSLLLSQVPLIDEGLMVNTGMFTTSDDKNDDDDDDDANVGTEKEKEKDKEKEKGNSNYFDDVLIGLDADVDTHGTFQELPAKTNNCDAYNENFDDEFDKY